MSGKKKFLMVLLVLVLLGSVAAGMLWSLDNYILVETHFYPRNVRQLDLRGEDISVKYFRKLQRRLPDSEILWDVPFQGKAVSCDTEVITVNAMTEQDLQTLTYFTKLKTVKAEGCTDYENLMKLRKSRPEIQVDYTVALGGETFSGTAKQIALSSVTDADIDNLVYLQELETVLCGGGNTQTVSRLREYCRERNVEFMISLGGEAIAPDTKEVNAASVTDEQLALLEFLPEMTSLHISNPEASVENLLAFETARPEVKLTWEREIYGKVYASDVEELDFSGTKIGDLGELDGVLTYFPHVKTVFLGECGIDNEVLAEHRNLVRDRYKLVWTVSCGNKLKTRTDATTFMPVREYVYYFNDEEAYNLRYCEDMVCIDIGHMSIHNIDFVEFMPNLQYLILAHTQLSYIDPIRHCKKLKFLELDWSPLKDLTPLKECTALEDLNLGNTFADFEPIKEMTWLKNLWMIDCSTRARYEMTQALPDTTVMVTGSGTVANGWRDLDNYYAMRDLLGMYYMSW